MQKLYYSSLFLMSVFLFASCQSEIHEEIGDQPPNPPSTVDTTLLVMKIEIEKTGPDPAIGDTSAYHYYTYDNKKRITAYRFDGSGPLLYVQDHSYFYQADELHPFKTTFTLHEGTMVQKDTSYYRWENGMVSWDSTIFNLDDVFAGTTVRAFSKVGGTVTIKYTFYADDGTPTPVVTEGTATATVVVNNGDIVEQMETGPALDQKLYIRSTYAPNPDPIHRVSINYPNFSAVEALSTQQHLPLATQYGNNAGDITTTSTSSYTFRNDGYPLTETLTWSSIQSPPNTIELHYFYMK